MRLSRLLVFVLVAYVGADLGSPLVPGAFTFDPADSVEAAGGYPARPFVVPRVVSPPAAILPLRPAAEGVAHPVRVPDPSSAVPWRPHAGRDHPGARDPRPALDDD
ncbi:MAG: hypothetical protein FJZ38_23940 [Candidatus Rokubacteria bacterium]|nr:hypothetical protein [Candidatus Rokubacteria bacterium]